MEDDKDQEEPGLIDKALSYVRGRASADQFKKLKPNPSPKTDPDKFKDFQKSFKRGR